MTCSICNARIVKGDASDVAYVEHLLLHILDMLPKPQPTSIHEVDAKRQSRILADMGVQQVKLADYVHLKDSPNTVTWEEWVAK